MIAKSAGLLGGAVQDLRDVVVSLSVRPPTPLPLARSLHPHPHTLHRRHHRCSPESGVGTSAF